MGTVESVHCGKITFRSDRYGVFKDIPLWKVQGVEPARFVKRTNNDRIGLDDDDNKLPDESHKSDNSDNDAPEPRIRAGRFSTEQNRIKEAVELLGVSQTATKSEIGRAWKAKILVTHPDKGGDAEDFKRVSAAHEFVLQLLV